ncbi:MAG TPA: type I pantothenate kinase, partial [Candidatus Corynebacterium intestinavium]|nr:type I pantothenate kinase [Candidatus Corynebacterium intestinavium]
MNRTPQRASADAAVSPFIELKRSQWRELRKSMPQVLSESELEQLRGIGDEIDLDEVSEVYLPLSRLINLRVEAQRSLNQATETFIGEPMPPTPYI